MKRVPFTAEPEIPEILTKWKAPKVSGDLAEIPQKNLTFQMVRKKSQCLPNITKDSQRFPENAKYGRTKCQILAPPYQDHAYPSLERLQRQGIRRSCRDPTCLGKITFLVNFQVNGYGTSEIVLYACDWCF